MTDRTPAEVNAALAKYYGWDVLDDPPNYCGDWAHAGPLLVNLALCEEGDGEPLLMKPQKEGKWVLDCGRIMRPARPHVPLIGVGKTPMEAIARADLVRLEAA